MLCVATPNPDAPAETYVRQHIQKLAPENTVVIYFDGEGNTLEGMPALPVRDRGTNRLIHLGRSFINMLVYGYPGAVSGQAARNVKDFLLKNNVRSVLAEFGPTGCALASVCNQLGIRLVVYFHGYDATVMPRRWVIRYAYHRLNELANAFVCGSKHFSHVLAHLGFDQDKIHVVPYGIELDQFESKGKKDSNLILAVGRLVEKKAPHLTIRAFQMVVEKCPNARLEIIGDGPLMNRCQELIRDGNLEEKVIMHGARPHDFVKQKLAQAGLFVQHSVIAPNGDTESLGVSLLEAMACEVPVVATRHNGFVETVIEGVTGYLVEEGDVAGMAERMVEILKDIPMRDRMGMAGRQWVDNHYGADKFIERLNDLLMI